MVCSRMEGRCDGWCERTGYREVAFREFDVVDAFVRFLDHRLEKNTPGSGIMQRNSLNWPEAASLSSQYPYELLTTLHAP